MPDGVEEIKDANEEHDQIRESLKEVEEHEAGTELFTLAVAQLVATTKHHVGVEEAELLPDFPRQQRRERARVTRTSLRGGEGEGLRFRRLLKLADQASEKKRCQLALVPSAHPPAAAKPSDRQRLCRSGASR